MGQSHFLLDFQYCKLIRSNEVMLSMLNDAVRAETFQASRVPTEVFDYL